MPLNHKFSKQPITKSPSTTQRLMYAGLLLAGFCYLFSSVLAPLDPYDEGVPLYGAWRILHGDWPYKDFWTMYAPLQFYVLAAVFKIFGTTVLVARIWDCCLRAGLAFLVYLLATKTVKPKMAIAPALLSLLWLERSGNFSYGVFPALLFSFLCLTCFISSLEENIATERKRILRFVAAFSLMVAGLYRHDFGIYLILTMLSSAIVLVLINRMQILHDSEQSLFEPVTTTLSVLTLCLLLAIAPSLYLISSIPLSDLVFCLIRFPIEIFAKTRALSFPSINSLLFSSGQIPVSAIDQWNYSEFLSFYFPFIILGLATFSGLICVARQQVILERRERCLICLTIFSFFLANQCSVRADFIHVLPLYFPSFILFFAMFSPHIGKSSTKSMLTVGLGMMLIVPMIARPLKAKGRAISQSFGYSSATRNTFDPLRPENLQLTANADQRSAAEYIIATSPASSYLYVGLPRHDLPLRADVSFYFLCNRKSATRFHELHPGISDNPTYQSQIIAELMQNTPFYIVLVDPYSSPNQQMTSPEATGATRLDLFLESHSEHLAQFGAYEIRLWKSQPIV